ncbi:MAG: hypothetical protein P4M13_05735 [Alphaproteobacteria bacterium]|nr:hypothetical protein [Alphaproteobacteria bacterium]
MARKIGLSWRQKAIRGVAALEFALTLPIWVAFLLGSSDGAYFLLASEKCDRIAYTLTDIVTQYQTITLANLADITLAAAQIMQPISFSGGNGVVIVSSVYQPSTGAPIVKWQYLYPNNEATQVSKIGTTGGQALLPNGLTLSANDNVIISEVYYTYNPLFINADAFKNTVIYRIAVYKPRLSPLVTPPT